MKKVLTIAGSDSGGGAGIQADLRTMAALGVWGMSAVTALTAQNTLGVSGIFPVSATFLSLQVEAVLGDLGADAVKTGMLHSPELIEAAAAVLRRYSVEKLVVDPVMVSKSGHRLLAEEGVKTMVRELFPLALVVTPNIPEAAVLAGMDIADIGDMKRAAARIGAMGPRVVVVKGGHLAEGSPDVVYDGEIVTLAGERHPAGTVHGTGCTFSAALACYLAMGRSIIDSVAGAKEFVTRAIASSEALGRGYPPANQLWK